MKIGEVVLFVDSTGQHHHALLTAIHGYSSVEDRNAASDAYDLEHPGIRDEEQKRASREATFMHPCVNVTYVSKDPNKTDSFGRQIERGATSVPHQSTSSAHGYYVREFDSTEPFNPVAPGTQR